MQIFVDITNIRSPQRHALCIRVKGTRINHILMTYHSRNVHGYWR